MTAAEERGEGLVTAGKAAYVYNLHRPVSSTTGLRVPAAQGSLGLYFWYHIPGIRVESYNSEFSLLLSCTCYVVPEAEGMRFFVFVRMTWTTIFRYVPSTPCHACDEMTHPLGQISKLVFSTMDKVQMLRMSRSRSFESHLCACYYLTCQVFTILPGYV